MNNLTKSWKTTAVGLAILLMIAYDFFKNGVPFEAQQIVEILIGFGLISAKDANQTHSSIPGGGIKPPPPPKKHHD